MDATDSSWRWCAGDRDGDGSWEIFPQAISGDDDGLFFAVKSWWWSLDVINVVSGIVTFLYNLVLQHCSVGEVLSCAAVIIALLTLLSTRIVFNSENKKNSPGTTSAGWLIKQILSAVALSWMMLGMYTLVFLNPIEPGDSNDFLGPDVEALPEYQRLYISGNKRTAWLPNASAAASIPHTPFWGDIHLAEGRFVDKEGRSLFLRGVNLAGDTKQPVKPLEDSHSGRDNFRDEEKLGSVSFVGRPFPLDEADEHFTRLRAWGLQFVRFLVTWEAVEHDGPGLYDYEYLDYLVEVIRMAANHNITVFIDPHQDVWSRFTGGDGAPAWTLDVVGFNISALYEAGATITHQGFGDPFPRMIWPSNYYRLACSTMFTLFWAGNDYAPKTRVDGVPVQDYLQAHFINAMQKVAFALRGEPNVIGFDTINEPSNGYAHMTDLVSLPQLRMGHALSPFASMVMGNGVAFDVDFYKLPFVKAGRDTLNTQAVSAWKTGFPGVWRENGVWDFRTKMNKNKKIQQAVLLRPGHFAAKTGSKGFINDYMVPFVKKYQKAIRRVMPKAVMFFEPHIDTVNPEISHEMDLTDIEDIVFTPHWYDILTLLTKSFSPLVGLNMATKMPVFGLSSVISAHKHTLAVIREGSEQVGRLGRAPTLLGETGIPMDMNAKNAFMTGNWRPQIAAMDMLMQALEQTMYSFTLWNYCPTNSHLRGDGWNDEDLSIFSRDDMAILKVGGGAAVAKSTTSKPSYVSRARELHNGGRVLPAVVRPYARRIAGFDVKQTFAMNSREYSLEFTVDASIAAPSVIFIPQYQYPLGVDIVLASGAVRVDSSSQVLYLLHEQDIDAHISGTAAAAARYHLKIKPTRERYKK